MRLKGPPDIKACEAGGNWTKVSFKPDLAKFHMTHLEDDVIALMKKRVIDLAGCLGKTEKIEVNGKRVPVKTRLCLKYAYENRPERSFLPRFSPFFLSD